MKFPLLFSVTLAAVGSVLFWSNAGGPAANNNRATGAPGGGGNTCVTCHNNSGGFGDVSLEIELTDGAGSSVTEYLADSVYEVTITVNNSMGSPAGYGFQMICLDSDDDNYDCWSNPSSNGQLSTSGGRDYVEHDGMSSSNVFTVDWTAPSEGTGEVTFYVGGNAVNESDDTGGDRAAIDAFSFDEMPADTTTGVEHAQNVEFALFPVPTADVLNFIGAENGSQVLVYSLNGARVMQSKIESGAIDVSNLETGFYLLEVESMKGSRKIFKL